MPTVQVSYHTDPACPWSGALEPVLRKQFDDSLRLTHVMCEIGELWDLS